MLIKFVLQFIIEFQIVGEKLMLKIAFSTKLSSPVFLIAFDIMFAMQ